MQLRALPLSALRAFEAAARHLSFASAARELGVTPAAVGLQVRSLEARVGRQLFIRRNRVLLLSQAGIKLSASLTDLFARMAIAVAEISTHGVSSLEVTTMPSFATKWLAPRLARFSVAYPDCQVRLVATDELMTFRDRRADVGIRYGPGGYEDLHAERLLEVVAYPVCSAEFARLNSQNMRSPTDLVHLPLLYDESSLIAPGLPAWKAWFEAAGVSGIDVSRKPIVFDSSYLAIESALAGRGVALGLSPLVRDDIAAGRLVRLFDISVASAFAFWFVCRHNRLNETRVSQYSDSQMSEAHGSSIK
jgi:LysR family glycine cleavage system transcriptional activator